jgi:hypothetical protein
LGPTTRFAAPSTRTAALATRLRHLRARLVLLQLPPRRHHLRPRRPPRPRHPTRPRIPTASQTTEDDLRRSSFVGKPLGEMCLLLLGASAAREIDRGMIPVRADIQTCDGRNLSELSTWHREAVGRRGCRRRPSRGGVSLVSKGFAEMAKLFVEPGRWRRGSRPVMLASSRWAIGRGRLSRHATACPG